MLFTIQYQWIQATVGLVVALFLYAILGIWFPYAFTPGYRLRFAVGALLFGLIVAFIVPMIDLSIDRGCF